jgi:transposase-like protein
MANHQRSAEKEAYWRTHVEGQAVGDVSVREYCLRFGLSEPSFYSWRRKLQLRDGHKTRRVPRRVPRRKRPADSSDSGPQGLVAVEITGSTDCQRELAVEALGGVTVRLREDVSWEVLQRVIVALSSSIRGDSVDQRPVFEC